MSNDKDSLVLADAIEDNLEYLQNHEYNPFEPDNQSQAFSVVVELSVQLAPILEALRQTTQSDALVTALRFYAREANYRSTTVYMSGQRGKTAIEIDGGQRARAALQEQSK